MFSIAEYTGKKMVRLSRDVSGIIALGAAVTKEALPWNRKGERVLFPLFLRQVLFTGVDALPIVTLISLLLGAVVIIQSTTQLPLFGAEEFIGKVIVVAIIRELGPLITAMVVIGRSCSAIAAELGLMRIHEEIEALESMGINPIRILVLPRVLGCLVSFLCLTVYFDVMAIMGGYVVSRAQLVTPLDLYLHRITAALELSDILVSQGKCVLFGLIISLLAIYNGWKVRRYATEVPQATTRAVMGAMLICFFINGLLTTVFYM